MDSKLIGRDAEIAQIRAFLSAASGAPAALVITGDAGIGKTAVWQHVLQAAGRSATVLSCQPASAERLLAFSALDDLLGDVAGEVLPALPGPRRRAVEVALLRDTSPGSGPVGPSGTGLPPPERRVLARGVLDALRILAARSPLVIAVDDAQWLDRPSAYALEFCLRRLQRERVSVLLTFGTDDAVPLGLDRALAPDRLGRVPLGPLSLGAIGEILRSRLGTVLPRYALTRLYDACGGNPFYALEWARMLLDHPHLPLAHEPIPLPQSLGGLVRRRVRRLTPGVQRVGRLVAASSDPRERLIRAACDDGESWAAIDQAIDEGIIKRDGEALRFTHPLLQSVLYSDMPLHERRQVHRRLGAAAEDIEERAWHLALGADRPSEEIAGMLDDASRRAASRGAPEAAATMAEQAARLTPADRRGAARERTVQAADYHFRGGSMARSRELIQSALAVCPAGPLRASLLLRLATIQYHLSGWPLAEQTFRQAAEEAPEDPARCAHAEQELAFARVVAGDLPGALHWAKLSLRSAELSADARLMAHSLARIAVVEFLQGHGLRLDLFDRAEALDASADDEPTGRLPLFSPSLGRGLVLKWCDRLDAARVILASQYRHALERGNEASVSFLLYHFSELECWAGNWDAAEEYALEGRRVAEESGQRTMTPAPLYCLALVRAHRGQVVQAQDLADQALVMCEQTGNVPLASQVLSILGFIALSLDDHQATVSHLDSLAEATAASGLGEPGVVKFLPDEIEALAALGEVDRAWSLTRQLEARGTSLGRQWALATAARCRAHLAAVDGDLLGARDACEQALGHHEQLPMPFELGRTLLVKGMIERRGKHKSAARESLGQALGVFEHLGAPLWADKTRRELSKIAIRAHADGLTDTEHRIAALVARGLTNREVASAMFVTENTVQTHVRHIFRKIGVRSRTELAVSYPLSR
jgi:DNA-binding CsgD family transcriptional regulator/tetratricopeptide (TPR) repeat protein